MLKTYGNNFKVPLGAGNYRQYVIFGNSKRDFYYQKSDNPEDYKCCIIS